MIWHAIHPNAHPDMLGFIPSFLSDNDPRPAKDQINENYIFGGGWNPLPKFKMLKNGNLSYPNDPETHLLFEAQLRHETIRFYEHSWLAIIQPDGSFEVARVD